MTDLLDAPAVSAGPYDLGLLAGRGPVCDLLAGHLSAAPHPFPVPAVHAADPVGDLDLQTALYVCYELHYRGFPGVDERWEWDPALLALRSALEQPFEEALLRAVPLRPVAADGVAAELWRLAGGTPGTGRSLSAWALAHGTVAHAAELAIHRAPYQLKEADPHTFAMPGIGGDALAAMATIQLDEYGEGRAGDVHARLFADTMEALGLDSRYGAYVQRVPAVSLATNNLFSLLSLHRRLRGAVVGHLAGFEMNSVVPMGRYSAWMDRLGLGAGARRFYDVHVTADETHQHIAADGLAATFAAEQPELARWVPWGAQALGHVEARFADHVLDAWEAGRSSLLAA